MRTIVTALLFAFLCLHGDTSFAGQATEASRIVVDMRGKAVVIPAEIKRIATIDDGFVEGVMTHLGVIDKLVAIASWGLKRDYAYSFETQKGEIFEHKGLNTMRFLHPWLDELVCFNSPQGDVLSYESLALVNPDLVILRAGDCTVSERAEDRVARIAEIIEALGIPLIVIKAPANAGLESMGEEMRVLGEVFQEPRKTLALTKYLQAIETDIHKRTANIAQDDKTRILYLGLSPDVRKKGLTGLVYGVNSPESFIIESIANAKNAFQGQGTNVPISAEQIYALDPDVIILPTSNGYHPPRELYESPAFASLQELRAIKNKRVYAMPWTPMNCARRLEYPLTMLVIAKAAYPERFKDFKVREFALDLYKDLYHVDDATAKGLFATQILDWMHKHDF